MSFQATVYRVFIASPGDLNEERGVIEDVIYDWNASHAVTDGVVLLPVRWETHSVPEHGGRPQEILNRRLVDACDILVGAFWTKLGTPTGLFASGTVEEIAEFRKAGKPALLYFSSRDAPLAKIDLDQLRAVREFQAQVQQIALTAEFSSPSNLQIQLFRQLNEQVRRLVKAAASGESQPEFSASSASASVSNATGSAEKTAESHELGELYERYWKAFSEVLRRSDLRLRPPAIRPTNYARFSVGRGDAWINAFTSVRDRFVGVELVLSRPECTELFERLIAERGEIENAFGTELDWKQLTGSYRIVIHQAGYDPTRKEDWERQHAWLIEALGSMQQILVSRIKEG